MNHKYEIRITRDDGVKVWAKYESESPPESSLETIVRHAIRRFNKNAKEHKEENIKSLKFFPRRKKHKRYEKIKRILHNSVCLQRDMSSRDKCDVLNFLEDHKQQFTKD